MKVKWLGHSAFLLTSATGKKVLTDPYKSGSFNGAVGYGPISEKADVVISSHKHDDHYCLDGLPTGYECFTSTGEHEAAGIKIKGIKTYHDTSQGKERGSNVVFVIDIDGIKVCHLGDLGHTISREEAGAIGKVDVLLIPVGGFFTIGPKEAVEVMKSLEPSVTIPMHFKTDALDFPIKPVEDFLSLAGDYEKAGATEIEIDKDDLGGRRIVVLDHEL